MIVPGTGDRLKNPSKEWAAHLWTGADLFAWLRLMAHGRYAFDLKHLYIGMTVTAVSAANTFLRYAQNHHFGERIKNTPFAEDPVFILGHWRGGTTLLHEYLMLDSRLACPSTAECFNPCHSLLTNKYLIKYFGWMLPNRRLIDNMAMGWERPQEDEFAMCLLGAPSPYLRIAFPNSGLVDEAAYDLDDLSEADCQRWEKTFYHLLQTFNYHHRKRLVLKSPPHTCRIPTLLKMFPGARFIHLVRNPYTVFLSTVNLWKTLHQAQGLHAPTNHGIEEYVFDRFLHFFHRYEATKSLIPKGQLIEMRYEDLVEDPITQVESVYRQLSLGDFEAVRGRLQDYVKANAGYKRNKWTLPVELRDQISKRWGEVIRQYGYSPPEG
ncbi:sulfotransferase family protein [Zavarzinella formosa]|uniref:sulfotransferase family protein n=1 Tax=Zavarzinella formosa TaxID=360055 RepID=UPI0003195C6A|nr:sulfotransferase [Zavarzinella formosa]